MENISFVDKVYDAYIKEDYSYGDNNLNPKREIKRMSLHDTDEQLNRILASIQRKVTEISMKYPVSDFKTDDAIGNFGGSGGKLDNIPASLREAIHSAGGTGTSLVMIPNMTGDTNPLMAEIELTIGRIITTIVSDPNSTDEDKLKYENMVGTGLDLFDINCNGTLSLINGEINGNSEIPDVDGNTGETDDDSSSSDSNFTTDSTDDTADAAMEDAVDKALELLDKEISGKKANARECAIKDLGLMKAFLAILNVINAIKQAMNPLMNILMDTVKLVVLAAGCWNNPTNISEIIQRIIIKLVAILIMIVALLVQMFWEMLGLDCLTEEAKSVIDQIKAALTGVTNTYNQCSRLAMSFGANVEKVTDAFDEAKSALDEVMKNLSTDHLKEMFPNMEDMAKDIYNNGLGGKEGIKQSALSGLQSTGAYDDILSTIESVKSLKESADKTIDALMKSKGGKGANVTVRKIASQLHNVQAK